MVGHRLVRTPFHVALFLWHLAGPSHRQRRLMIGKIRRHFLVYFRPRKVERMLEERRGACTRCGVCCRLGFACAHLDPETRLCGVHEMKPAVCRTFPLDARDIADRNLVSPSPRCGYRFPKN